MAHRRFVFPMPAPEAVVFDAFHFHHWRRQWDSLVRSTTVEGGAPCPSVGAVTHNAAASLGLDHEVGSIVAGRSADLLELETPDWRDLVYHAGSPLVGAVWHAGERVA